MLQADVDPRLRFGLTCSPVSRLLECNPLRSAELLEGRPVSTRRIVSLCGVGLFALLATTARGELTVSSDFENGSAAVDGIDQKSGTIRIHPAGDPQRGWPCWWSFKVDGIEPGRTITIEIDRTTGNLPVGTGAGSEGKPLNPIWSHPDRATYSIDGGKTWQHSEVGQTEDGRRRYAIRIDAPRAWFAWGPVFAVGDAQALVDQLAAEHPYAKTFELAKTREGRAVPALVVRAGDAKDDDRYGIWVQARQHAWESGGSWVGRGFIEWLVSDDPRAVALREKSVVYYVPVMDVDSVATGNGGKGQNPQDHNRDWSATPHFPEVAAAQRKIAELDAAKRFDYFIDLHNPGQSEKRPYFYASPDEILSPVGRRNLQSFLAAARTEMTGPLQIEPNSKPSGASYSPKWREISKNWVKANTREHVVALTLETVWNTPHSTTTGYRTVGKQLGLAIERYLRESPRTP